MHDAQNLQGRNDAIASGREIAEDHVTALLAAEVQFLLHHLLNHVAVANLRAHNFSTVCRERLIGAKITHDSGDNCVPINAPTLEKIESGTGEQLIAIDDLAVLIAK